MREDKIGDACSIHVTDDQGIRNIRRKPEKKKKIQFSRQESRRKSNVEVNLK
jgi:hypothetical protein